MAYNWKLLAPHRPLDADSELYVPRPLGSGKLLAQKLRRTPRPILVAGPAGVGKSTELARTKVELGADHPCVHLRVDRTDDPRKLTGKGLLRRIAVEMCAAAEGGTPPLRGDVESDPTFDDVTLKLLRSVRKKMGEYPILLLDGMEKVPVESLLPLTEMLQREFPETPKALVVPLAIVYGSRLEEFFGGDAIVHAVSPLEISGEEGKSGRVFLAKVLQRRLGLQRVPAGLTATHQRAAVWSGGVVRTYLQLMVDAAGYAELEGLKLPQILHLNQAVADQRDSLRRLLIAGDTSRIAEADGTDGRELPLATRIRLLSHGLLLEYEDEPVPTVRPHPLIEELISHA